MAETESGLYDSLENEVDDLAHHLPSAEYIVDLVEEKLKEIKQDGRMDSNWLKIYAGSVADDWARDTISSVLHSRHSVERSIRELLHVRLGIKKEDE